MAKAVTKLRARIGVFTTESGGVPPLHRQVLIVHAVLLVVGAGLLLSDR